MRGLNNRVSALERDAPTLSAQVKAWLGWPLSDAERSEAERDVDVAHINTSALSKEDQQWLGIA
jgi:hypothetical protein